MACGLGAVILVFMLVEFKQGPSVTEEDDLRGDLSRLAAAELELRRTLGDAQENSSEAERMISDASQTVSGLDAQTAEVVAQNDATRLDIEKLREEIESQSLVPPVKEPVADANSREQYLIGLKVEGPRIGILLDQSSSMTDRRLIDIVRRKNAPTMQRKTGPKWLRTIKVVTWLLARLPEGSQVAIVAYSQRGRVLGDGWVPANDTGGLSRLLEEVAAIDPVGPTNLQAGLKALNGLRPSDIYVVTDGLPTQGVSNYKSLNPFADCNALWGNSNTISGQCRERLFDYTVKEDGLISGAKVNTILLPVEGDPGAAFAYWRWTAVTGGLTISPAETWP